MTTPDLTGPRAAITASQATRATMRGRSPDDPERVAALRAALGSLRDSWTDEHRAYVRSGPRNGRWTAAADPVVKLGHERREENRRLRKMLSVSSGTPYKAATERRNADSMSSTLATAVRVLSGIGRSHDAIVKLHGGGSWTATRNGGGFRNMRELNAEAEKLLDQLHEFRIELNAAWAAYERHLASRRASTADRRRHQALSDRLHHWRDDADELAAKLRNTARRRTPIERPRERWTADAARSALRGFQMVNGRPARKVDCHPTNGLPHYTQLRRLLGPNPLSG